MNKKVWSISTTVRNPDRTRNFLKTLKELEGEEWNKNTQSMYQKLLIKNRYFGYGNTQFYNGLTQDLKDKVDNINYDLTFSEIDEILRIKNYRGGTDMRGRQSRKPLEKFGFTYLDNDNKIVISSLGDYLLEEDYDLSELMFKSLLKWQLPNPVDREFNNIEIYNIRPFMGIMHLIKKVNNIAQDRGLTVKGISKEEFMIFGLSLINYNDINSFAEKLITFRIQKENLNSREEKRLFVENYKNIFLEEYINSDNIKDYIDNSIRYFRLTKYFYIRGGGYYIDLEPRREIEINKLLEEFDGSSKVFSREEYINYISDINLPILPWETRTELLLIYGKIIDEINLLRNELNINEDIEGINSLEEQDIQYIKDKIIYLRTFRKKIQNIKLKYELQNVSKIDEAINCLTNIRQLDLKPSIALEKWVTIALNIINDSKEIKSNAPFGDDNEILFTAPAGKPDIECFYEEFNSVCEVTMLNSRSQWINEGQPVMRHLRDFEDISDNENNYAIFIAPSLHRDTINTFWTSVKYEYEEVKQKIIPITITQLIEILFIMKEVKINNYNFSHIKFKELLDDIVNVEGIRNSVNWVNQIPEKINNWKNNILSN